MATTDPRDRARTEQQTEYPPLVDPQPSLPTNLTISVVWATVDHVTSISLVVPVGTQVGQAIELSGLLQKYQPTGFAIFGQRCDLTRILSDGDRIELCRPLVVEPKAARRRRALHREKVRNIKKKMPIDDLTV